MRHPRFLVLATCLWLAPLSAAAQDTTLNAPPTPVVAPGALATETPVSVPDEGVVTPPAVGATTPTMPSVGSLFRQLPHDLRRTATADNAVIVLTASASAALIHPYDFRLTDHFSSSPALEKILGPGQAVGSFVAQFGGAWAAYGIGRYVKHERTAEVGADLVRAQIVNMLFTQGLKLSINRTRPDGDPWSFPSGHSSSTFANAAVLHRHFGWKVGAPAYAVATYVAASRLQANRHFASDVIVGAGIGLVSGRAVTVGRGANRFAVAPMGVPGGGAGISFTRIAN
jgi:membrane-associated phospholipid phosphatase